VTKNADPQDVEIGKRIRQYRNFRDRTQTWLGNKLSPKKSQQGVHHIETGVSGIKARDLVLVSECLDVDVDYLLYGDRTQDGVSGKRVKKVE